jgi:hypothetical protein
MAAIVAFGLAASVSQSNARADTYRSGDYVFEIAGLSLERVQDEVVSAIRLPLSSQGIQQIVRWSATPCYRVGNARGYVGEVTLSSVIGLLNARLPYRLEPCLAKDQPAITYYLVGSAPDPEDRRELMTRLFPPADLECDWNQTAADRDSGLITSALVVARSTASSTRHTTDCLMRNTVQALGVGWYESRDGNDPGALTGKSDARELNLLALFVRYQLTQELGTFKSLYQVERRIEALVAEMHTAGALSQNQ